MKTQSLGDKGLDGAGVAGHDEVSGVTGDEVGDVVADDVAGVGDEVRAELRGASLHSDTELLHSHTTCMSIMRMVVMMILVIRMQMRMIMMIESSWFQCEEERRMVKVRILNVLTKSKRNIFV